MLFQNFFPIAFLVKINNHKICNILSFEREGEAKQRNTFWLVIWHHVFRRTFETILGDVIDTLTNKTPAADQEFIQKMSNWYVLFIESHTEKVDVTGLFSAIFRPNFWKFAKQTTQKETRTYKRRPLFECILDE